MPGQKGSPDAGLRWGREELRDPHGVRDKAVRVRGMFDAIARRYDLNNRVHSVGLDGWWRRAAVRMASVRAGERVVDVACGTAELTIAMARTAAAEVIGVDFSAAMLEVGRRKVARLPVAVSSRIRLIEGDAHRLPIADGSADVVSIAWGLRNLENPVGALQEFRRVLRAGGRVVVLEFDRPGAPVLREVTDVYRRWVMPRTATWLAGDRTGAYRYLPASVDAFAGWVEVARWMGQVGFERVRVRRLSLGICVCVRGELAG